MATAARIFRQIRLVYSACCASFVVSSGEPNRLVINPGAQGWLVLDAASAQFNGPAVEQMRALIDDWRKIWNRPGVLFYVVQLSTWCSPTEPNSAGKGLIIGRNQRRMQAAEDPTGKIKRFAVAGADNMWRWANAVIGSQAVVFSSPRGKRPVAQRYAFTQNPHGALYNRVMDCWPYPLAPTIGETNKLLLASLTNAISCVSRAVDLSHSSMELRL